MGKSAAKLKKNSITTFLDSIEAIGNKLPHPTSLFILLTGTILILSAVFEALQLSASHPLNGTTVKVVNLLSQEGLHKILTHTVTNFTGFAPVGTVLVAMLGIGIAEYTGLIATSLRLLVETAPKQVIAYVVVMAGVLSSLAADAGYVVLIPVAALIFLAAGRHPVAGIAAAFAGVSGGFSANLLIGPVDAILSGISTEAVHLVDTQYEVSATGNYYFIVASTFVITLIGGLVTDHIIEPRMGQYKSDNQEENTLEEPNENNQVISPAEKKGLWYCLMVLFIVTGLLLYGLLPEAGILRNPETGSILKSPFISGIVTIIAFTLGLAGIAYGIGAGTVTSDKDVIKSMEISMASMASYIVLMFFAAQFVSYFSWTNLGLITAIKGSDLIQQLQLGPLPLLLFFIVFAASINLVIGSASAKWSIMAPIFVPMLFIAGISPEATQAAYRVGDSVTNIITPLMPYFAVVVAFVQRYDKSSGLGTIAAMMLPFSFMFLLGWSVFFIFWFSFDFPLGPGANILINR